MARVSFANQYFVYIMTNKPRGVLYTGMSNDIRNRVYQHKTKTVAGFTSRYNLTRLAYFEMTSAVYAAIVREKQIKSWRTEKKIALIESVNPDWKDLAEDWYEGMVFDEAADPPPDRLTPCS